MIEKATDCIKYAQKEKKINEIDVVFEKNDSISVSVRDGKVEKIDDSCVSAYGVRIVHDRRQAIISNVDLDNYRADVDQLLDISKSLPEDEFVGLSTSESLVKGAVFDDAKIERPAEKDLIDAALAIESGAKEAGAFTVETASIEFNKKTLRFLGSNGFSGEFRKSYITCCAMVVAKNSEGMEHGDKFRIFTSSPGGYTAIGEEAARKALSRLGSKKIKSGKMPVIIDREAAGSFLGHVVSALNGVVISSKASMFCDKINEKCFDTNISILDDPSVEGGVNSIGFDADGLAPESMYLVRHGHIRNYLLDSYTARKLKLITNRRAQRSAASLPHPSCTNVTLLPTSNTKDQMLKNITSGVYITDFIGMGVNILTGDHSVGCAGFMIENGEIAYPVSEIVMSCSLLDVFKRMVPLDDLFVEFGVDSPSIYIDEVMIGGE